jgi:ElaB/YqjD/DUF883 family membrane-anchored ribosome-binding protein
MIDMTLEPSSALPTVESAQTEAEVEDKLKDEIQALWSAHQVTMASTKHTKQELKTLRLDLGEKLCQLKATLARTGRGGGWAAYLRSHHFPRATAERYIDHHEALLNPDKKRVSEAISEPSEDDVRRLVHSLMPRLRRVLVTSKWVAEFLQEVALQWGSTDEVPTGGEVNEPGAIADGDCGNPSDTEVGSFPCAA